MGLHGMPVLMITDLDRSPCPPALIADRLGAPSSGFLFRVCVREVEAWLLADRPAIAAFLKFSLSSVPIQPEQLDDPKAELIRLAKYAPRAIRTGLTPVGSATIDPEYNTLLTTFISDTRSPKVAVLTAPSLARAYQRLRALAANLRKEGEDGG